MKKTNIYDITLSSKPSAEISVGTGPGICLDECLRTQEGGMAHLQVESRSQLLRLGIPACAGSQSRFGDQEAALVPIVGLVTLICRQNSQYAGRFPLRVAGNENARNGSNLSKEDVS